MAPTPSRGASAGLKTTPRSSPRVRGPLTRPPNRTIPVQLRLALNRVIGTTAASPTSFDVLDSKSCIAYTAGAVAVVCNLESDGQFSQRFFGARPSSSQTTPAIPGTPPTPITVKSSPQPRSRTTTSPKDRGSYFPSASLKSGKSSPNSKKSALNERTKTLACISLSRNGKLLAVGETGHNPRILVFSTEGAATTNAPFITLTEHNFGIHCLAFSPDSQYLASMGELNDGFLHIWKIDHRSGTAILHASNKCTSNTRQIAWLGNSLITVGTRHVKLWRIQETYEDVSQQSCNSFYAASVLPGRNCILGGLMDQVFPAVAAISFNKAVVCSENGDICILNDSDNSPRLVKVAETGFPVTAIAVQHHQRLIVAGIGSSGVSFPLEDLLELATDCSPPKLLYGSPLGLVETSSSVSAMGFLQDQLVVLGANRNLRRMPLAADPLASDSVFNSLHIPAHSTTVVGVRALAPINSLQAAFLTWSTDGCISFWNFHGVLTRSVWAVLGESSCTMERPNQLTVVHTFDKLSHIVFGDREGLLRVQNLQNSACLSRLKAHATEVTDIAVFEDDDIAYIATCGRDRFIQVFRRTVSGIELIQTLDEHMSAVNRICFSQDGSLLVSSSSDRSVVIRQMVHSLDFSDNPPSFLKSKSIALKSSPLSFDLGPTQESTLFLSTADRRVQTYMVQSGAFIADFKAMDSEGAEPVALNGIAYCSLKDGVKFIVGVSNADKSVRVYDDVGRLLACEYGHADGITSIAVIRDSDNGVESMSVVTTAIDGTVFIWNMIVGEEASAAEAKNGGSLYNVSQPLEPPLRRILSSIEVARLQNLRISQNDSPLSVAGAEESPSLARARRPSKLSVSQTPSGKDSSPTNNRRALQSHVLPLPTGNGYRNSRQSPSPIRRFNSEVGTSPSRSPSRSRMALQRNGSFKQDLEQHESTITSGLGEYHAVSQDINQLASSLKAMREQISVHPGAISSDEARRLEDELRATLTLVSSEAVQQANVT